MPDIKQTDPKPATEPTRKLHADTLSHLDFNDNSCFADAARGFVGSIPNARVTAADGRVVWDVSAYHFLEQQTAPDTVNPSLWRQARLNNHHGLFEVTEGLYQVRGLDIANMTIIEGHTGVILIDPLMNTETSAAALALYRKHRGERPVHTVIYSHSHPDHYGGAEGVVSPDQAKSGEIEVIAPEGFLEAALSETILAGVPMRRRAMFQFGPALPSEPCGHVDSGLGRMTGRGTTSLVAPNRLIKEPIETQTIDGVEIVFQLTPETEAPAEMNFFFPASGVLNLAENGCHTMHNLCPIRGARTRDALAWSKYLDDALNRFINQTDVVIAQHHWPTWGRERVRQFIIEQRDMYRYLHDQTLRLMGHGLTPNEIAEAITMPPGLDKAWHARPYYGALEHNVRSIYVHYMGPYDGNPVNLNPLAPVPAGKKYVEYMGGANNIMDKAQRDFESGDYRWVVQVLHHLVFAQPDHQAARLLAADAIEQLGYQAESATWRNAYLQGARELRHGAPKPPPGGIGMISPKVVAMMPLEMLLDFIAVRLNGPKADGRDCLIDWYITDTNDVRCLTLSHGALNHASGSHGESADVTIRMTRSQLSAVLVSGKPLLQTFDEGLIQCEGNTTAVRRLFECLDEFYPMFNILEP